MNISILHGEQCPGFLAASDAVDPSQLPVYSPTLSPSHSISLPLLFKLFTWVPSLTFFAQNFCCISNPLECVCKRAISTLSRASLHHGEWVVVRAVIQPSLMVRMDALLPPEMHACISVSDVSHGSSCTLTLGPSRNPFRE